MKDLKQTSANSQELKNLKQSRFRALIATKARSLPRKELYSKEIEEFLNSKPKTKREKEIDKDYTF